MPVIVGAPRSGTTLLRFMLDSHPDLAIPPETGFLVLGADPSLRREGATREEFFSAITRFPEDSPAWQDFGIPADLFRAELERIEPFRAPDAYRAFYRLYAERMGKSRWGDKTPTYCLHMETIRDLLPEAHFLHIIRDGRDVALSLRQTWFSPGPDMKSQALLWQNCVLSAREQAQRCPAYMEVRYEELIQAPRPALEAVCRFLSLEFHSSMLSYFTRVPERLKEHRARLRVDGSVVVTREQRLRQQHLTARPPDRSRVFAWRQTMTRRERIEFERFAGEGLRACGYALAED